jgi:MarR family transcriptional regulator, 2-MHQ and catechol-resistance regulon repressor
LCKEIMGTSQERALKLFVVLSRAATAVSAHADADAARHGLSPAEFGSLEALYQKGPLLVGQLQRAVLKSSGGMTYVVDRLQDKGLVRRRPCPDDRRALYAELTEEGRALMDRIFPEHAAAIERAVAGLSPADQATAVELLRRLGHSAAEAVPKAARRRTARVPSGDVATAPRATPPDGGSSPARGGRTRA